TTAALRDSRRDPAPSWSHGSAWTTAALRDSRRDPAPSWSLEEAADADLLQPAAEQRPGERGAEEHGREREPDQRRDGPDGGAGALGSPSDEGERADDQPGGEHAGEEQDPQGLHVGVEARELVAAHLDGELAAFE